MALVDLTVENHIARITMNRAERKNALNPEMIVRLADAWEKVRDDDDVRVAVITGTGDTFCSGADLGQLIPILTGAKEPENEWDHRVADDRRLIFKALLRNFDTEKPVIAAVTGHAIAGGMEMLQGIDMRVAAPGVRLGVQEVKWALFPGGGSTVRLPRQIPYAKAMELLLTGDTIMSEEALALGFVNHVVPADEVLAKAMDIAGRIAANGPVAVKNIRASARACQGLPEKDALRLENKYSAPVLATEDAREGPRAFREKRKPVYVGR